MAEFDPDEFIKGGKEKEFTPDEFLKGGESHPAEPPDPGGLAALGRFGRGAMTGVESTVAGIGQSLPWFLQGPNQDLARKVLADRPPPKDRIESAGQIVGETLPAFAIPELGFEGLAARYLPNAPRIAQFLGKTAEGVTGGAVGGAMLPEGRELKNTTTGAEAGGAMGAAAGAYMALPPGLRRLANAAAAAGAAETVAQMGLPRWYIGAPIYWEIYHQRLLDLATQWLAKKGAGVGAVGATGIRLKEGQEKQ